jgi:hypothetical protein
MFYIPHTISIANKLHHLVVEGLRLEIDNDVVLHVLERDEDGIRLQVMQPYDVAMTDHGILVDVVAEDLDDPRGLLLEREVGLPLHGILWITCLDDAEKLRNVTSVVEGCLLLVVQFA